MCSSVGCKVYLPPFILLLLGVATEFVFSDSSEYDYHHLLCPDFDVSVMENGKDWASDRGRRWTIG